MLDLPNIALRVYEIDKPDDASLTYWRVLEEVSAAVKKHSPQVASETSSTKMSIDKANHLSADVLSNVAKTLLATSTDLDDYAMGVHDALGEALKRIKDQLIPMLLYA